MLRTEEEIRDCINRIERQRERIRAIRRRGMELLIDKLPLGEVLSAVDTMLNMGKKGASFYPVLKYVIGEDTGDEEALASGELQTLPDWLTENENFLTGLEKKLGA